MISKTSKFIFSSLVLASSILNFSLPKVSVQANDEFYRIVTHPNGVNIRDKNCNIIGQAGYGEVLFSKTGNSVSVGCNINGEKNMEMANYGVYLGGDKPIENMFVSTRYTRAVNSGSTGTFTTLNKIRLNNSDGVNIRDASCQRVKTLPNGTYSDGTYSEYSNDIFSPVAKVCKAGNEFYYMIPFVYKGKVYQVAEVLTKYE